MVQCDNFGGSRAADLAIGTPVTITYTPPGAENESGGCWRGVVGSSVSVAAAAPVGNTAETPAASALAVPVADAAASPFPTAVNPPVAIAAPIGLADGRQYGRRRECGRKQP